MPSSSKLWRREFKRSSAPDLDVVASQAFLKANVTDFFGKWIQEESNSQIRTFDEILMRFYEGSKKTPPQNSFSIFCVADGGEVPSTPQNEAWLQLPVRFVAVIASGDDGPFSSAQGAWTLFIVGSEALDSKEAFMQVASWDGKAFRFYSRDLIQNRSAPRGTLAWLYQAKSTDAFNDQVSYLGPFDGHVNGAVIMKELRKPWIHWMSADSSIVTNLPERDKKRFAKAPYLSSPTDGLCGRVATPDVLEPIVENGVDSWYAQRKLNDFGAAGSLSIVASNTKRWMAHILLTTTINMRPAAQSLSSKETWEAPSDHFYNNELLSLVDEAPGLLTSVKVPRFSFKMPLYQKAAQNLELVRIQPVFGNPKGSPKVVTLSRGTLGGGKLTNSYDLRKFAIAADGEAIPFTILQTSYEDAQGGFVMQNIYTPKDGPHVSLISSQTFNAIMMVDFWNPVYSWRRAALAEYVPDTARFDSKKQTYDLEDTFINNVKSSAACMHDPTSPESQFMSLLNSSITTSRKRIQAYMNAVQERLGTEEGIIDYLKLAESRRRIYRPVPLDEFGLTLPYSLKYPTASYFEMTESGQVVPMDKRGVELYSQYIIGNPKKNMPGSLAGYDPQIFPAADGICPARKRRRAPSLTHDAADTAWGRQPSLATTSMQDRLDIGWKQTMIYRHMDDFPTCLAVPAILVIIVIVIATTVPKRLRSSGWFSFISFSDPRPKTNQHDRSGSEEVKPVINDEKCSRSE